MRLGNRCILVDALSARVGGGLTFITEQLVALGRARPDLALSVLASPLNGEFIRAAVGCDVRVLNLGNLPARLAYEQIVLPHVRFGDLIYCPANFCPLVNRSRPIVLCAQNAHYFGLGKRVPHDNPMRKRVEIKLAHASVRRADLVVAVSEFLGSQIVDDGIAPRKVRVIPSGVSSFEGLARMPGLLEGTPEFFLQIGNDHAVKRQDDLVAAWSSAFHGSADAPALVLVGRVSTERMREQRRLLKSSFQQPKLIHLGAVSDRSVIKWLLLNARALISTSELESVGLTVTEALSLSCPTVVTNIPAHREIAGKETQLFPVGDVAALAQCLRSMGPRDHGLTGSDPRSSWAKNAIALGEVFDEVIETASFRGKR